MAAPFLILLLLQFLQFRAVSSTCGGYIVASAHSSGYLTSPGFPAPYGIAQQCIWAFDVPSGYALRFNFTVLKLQSPTNGGCDDYVEIRNRNFEGNVSFKGCQQSSPTLVQTPSAYAWVKFYSNHQTVNQGFNVTWSVVNTGVTSATFKRICHISMFQCGNKECIHRAYLCDSFNDCGCSTWDCDESDYFCKKPVLELWALYTIAGSIGFVVFLIIFFVFGCMESHSHHRRMAASEEKRGVVGNGAGWCGCCVRSETKEEKAAREEEEKLEQAYQQMIEIMMDGKRVINWDSDATSAKTSPAPSRQPSITEASLPTRPQPPLKKFGNTLSPKDVPRTVKT